MPNWPADHSAKHAEAARKGWKNRPRRHGPMHQHHREPESWEARLARQSSERALAEEQERARHRAGKTNRARKPVVIAMDAATARRQELERVTEARDRGKAEWSAVDTAQQRWEDAEKVASQQRQAYREKYGTDFY